VDPEVKKQALRRIVHGVYVIGVCDGERRNAFTATWITQISFEPPLVAVGVRKDSLSFGMIEASGVFTVNLLGAGQKPLAQHFIKPAHLGGDKLAGVPHRAGSTGAPILEEAPAFLECRVQAIHPAGDHSIVVGEVVEAGLGKAAEPLTLKETGWQYGG
jgi:flavin reductase (DIM6/NTAB) family NADH-FMN oxidoreductase RutF